MLFLGCTTAKRKWLQSRFRDDPASRGVSSFSDKLGQDASENEKTNTKLHQIESLTHIGLPTYLARKLSIQQLATYMIPVILRYFCIE